jgi:hypothetical protein
MVLPIGTKMPECGSDEYRQYAEQVMLLRAVGFEVSDVAAMLGMTENHVNVAAHHGRKNFGKKRPKK